MGTLALNMIIGPGDAESLRYCLESFDVKNTFDEIVLVRTSGDSDVEKVCAEYATESPLFAWCSERYPYGDFAGARNCAIDHTTCDKIMWLDADDECEQPELLPKLKDKIHDSTTDIIDVFMVPYTIVKDGQGNPSVQFMRQRIFKRSKAWRWRNPVHEQIGPSDLTTCNVGEIRNLQVVHRPMKPASASAARNVKILAHELARGGAPSEMRFFYTRDLMLAGDICKAEELIGEMMADLTDSFMPMYELCLDMLMCKVYGYVNVEPRLDEITDANKKDLEKWARMCIAFSTKQAEPYVIIGDKYMTEGHYELAEKCYFEALKKTIGKSCCQLVPYYEEIPAKRLCEIYLYRRDFDKALWYNGRSLVHNPSEDNMERREMLVQVLAEELKNRGERVVDRAAKAVERGRYD